MLRVEPFQKAMKWKKKKDPGESLGGTGEI